MRLFDELKRRNVFRVAGVYAVVGWLLAQAAGVLENSLNMPGWFDTVAVSALLLGFPVAIILAWAFELTPEGVKFTANVPEGESITAKTGRKLDYAILAGVALIAVLFVFERVTPSSIEERRKAGAPQEGASGIPQAEEASAPSDGGVSEDAPAASIAVLPFADMSPGRDQEYFSDGIAEEILNVLACVDGLKVASRTSSFQFRKSERGIPAIASELGVRHVLEGSVRKSGDAIRVTAQLIDAKADAHLWSETFDRTLTAENVFAIQDEIASAIVGALHERIGGVIAAAVPASSVRTSDVEAYELFLKARALFQSRRNLGEADELLKEALAIDPKFADALAIRAAIHQFGGEYGARFEDERGERARGREFAAEALKIAPDNSLALAITALSLLYDRIEGYGTEDYAKIFAAFDRALEIEPKNANALNWLGIAHNYLGENEKAAAVHRRCIEVDPALAACRSNLMMELLSEGKRDEAEAALDAAIDTGAFAVGPGQMLLFADMKRRDAFLLLSLNVPALRGFHKFNALYDALADPAGDDRALAAELKALIAENDGSLRVNALLNALGDYSTPTLITVQWLDALTGYRRSPEFKAHMRASGAYDYWRRRGFPAQCKPKGKDDFECE
jgi:TolB-like protein